MRVSDYLAKYLVEKGVKTIFLVSGGGIMHLLDGIRCNDQIEYVCCHNEAAGAIMAEGYARVSGNVGVCMVTTGPGATNAVTGAVDAWIDSIPIIVISGQTKRSQNVYNYGIEGLRQIGGQEVHILPIVHSFCKYSAMINDPNEIKYHLDRAFFEAKNGRPGPCWLDIPMDVQGAKINESDLIGYTQKKRVVTEAEREQVKKVVELLSTSKRPLFIFGNGITQAQARDDANRIVESSGIPVVASKLGQDIIQNDSIFFVGFGGTRGVRAANLAMQNCDLLISIGSRLANPFIGYEAELFAREARKVVVDFDPRELKKFKFKVDISINMDAKDFIICLMKELGKANKKDYATWVDKCNHWKRKYSITKERRTASESLISIYEFFEALSDLAPESSVLIGDAGSSYYVVSQGTSAKKGQRIVSPAGLGSMGLSLPLGIGCHYADKYRLVAAVTGEGSLQMNIQELQTLKHYDIPLKLFVINNGGYFSIKRSQEDNFQGRYCGSEPSSGVSFPDLSKVSRAYGLKYIKVRSRKGLRQKIASVLQSEGPFICEIFTDPCERIRPSVTSKTLPDGRMLSMPIEDMFPFLPREELKKEMVIPLTPASLQNDSP